MAEDDVCYADIDEHGRRNFAREGAIFFPVHILSSDVNSRAFGHFNSRRKIRENGSDDDFSFYVFGHFFDEALDRSLSVCA